jgi:acetyl-CoA carboxylase biotin carboxyl carrier protein
MLDLREIKLIVDLMKKSDLTEFEIEQKDLKLKIKRSFGSAPVVEAPPGTHPPFYQAPVAALPVAVPAAVASAGGAGTASPVPAEEAGVTYIKSPMVGTFYRSPSPESPPFVEIGAKVQETTVVCILEAMKIMNEIQAEAKGVVIEALVENGQPVEFGQKLFKLKAA